MMPHRDWCEAQMGLCSGIKVTTCCSEASSEGPLRMTFVVGDKFP